VPPAGLQWREERRVEQLNTETYGAAWAWLPLPVWLTLVDPYSDGSELLRLARAWESRREHGAHEGPRRAAVRNRTLPVLRA
jgi:hypothetical protein